VVDRGAAAAANKVDAVFSNEPFHPGRQFVGAQRVMGVPIDQFGKAGIRLHGQQTGPVGGQPMQMLGHFAWAGAAVQSDQRNVQRVHHGRGGSDIRTHQQRAGGLHGDLHEDRRVGAGFSPGEFRAIDCGFDLQRVLAGFDQNCIDTAGDQAAALFCQGSLQRIVGDVAQAWQLRSGADTSYHPAVPSVGEAFRRFPCQFGGLLIDLESPFSEIEFTQRHRRGTERIGLHHVGAGGEKPMMDLADEVGSRQHQNIGAILAAPIILLHIQRQRLRATAHAAVAQQHLVA
jgi:hypothetical protein